MSERLSEREHRSPYRNREALRESAYDDLKAASDAKIQELTRQLAIANNEIEVLRSQRDDVFRTIGPTMDKVTHLEAELKALKSSQSKVAASSKPGESAIPNSPVTDKVAGRDNSMAGTGVEQGPEEKQAGKEAAKQPPAQSSANIPGASEKEKADVKQAEDQKAKEAAQQTAQPKPGSPSPVMDKELDADNSRAGTGVPQSKEGEKKAADAKAQADREAAKEKEAREARHPKR